MHAAVAGNTPEKISIGWRTTTAAGENLLIGKLYRKERIGFTAWPLGRRLAGRFEGSVRAISPI